MSLMDTMEEATYSTVKITRYKADKQLGTGTGFIVELPLRISNKKLLQVIITNMHVVSKCDTVLLQFVERDSLGQPIDTYSLDVETKACEWIQHPYKLDLSCLPLGSALSKVDQGNQPFYTCFPASSIYVRPTKNDDRPLRPFERVIAAGYPRGLYDSHNHKPIIRTGLISTHLDKPYENKHEFLVDMPCFEGMSGAPVFVEYESTVQIKHNHETIVSTAYGVKLIGILYEWYYFKQGSNELYRSNTNEGINIPLNIGAVLTIDNILDFIDCLEVIA